MEWFLKPQLMNDLAATLRTARLLYIGKSEILEGFKQRSSRMKFRRSISDAELRMDWNEYGQEQEAQSEAVVRVRDGGGPVRPVGMWEAN